MTDKPTVTQADIRLHNRLVMSIPEPTREEGRQLIAAHREAAIKEAVDLIERLIAWSDGKIARDKDAKAVWSQARTFLISAKGQAEITPTLDSYSITELRDAYHRKVSEQLATEKSSDTCQTVTLNQKGQADE